MFKFIRQKRERVKKAQFLYERAFSQSRHKIFYTEMQVPDSFEGRFEMLSLHVFLVMRRLNNESQNKTAQLLFDIMFKTIDKSLREIGIGDLGVPKHMKRMMQGFNGRAHSYEAAIYSNDQAALAEALSLNVYSVAQNQPMNSSVDALASYMMSSAGLTESNSYFMDLDMVENMKVENG